MSLLEHCPQEEQRQQLQYCLNVGMEKSSGLTADEKATISAIADLTGSVTKATVSGNMADVAQGNQAGNIAVDNNAVLVDKIRNLIEDAKEYWHTEKEAKDHLDVIRNIAFNTIGDGLDGAVGITDYIIYSLKLIYCLGVTPDLCNQMHATLDPKTKHYKMLLKHYSIYADIFSFIRC